jgi:hypothetical protein
MTDLDRFKRVAFVPANGTDPGAPWLLLVPALLKHVSDTPAAPVQRWPPAQTARQAVTNKCSISLRWIFWKYIIFKGIMSPVEYFFKAYTIKSILCVHALLVLTFLANLVQEKNMEFLLASLKTLTNSKNCSVNRIKYSSCDIIPLKIVCFFENTY